MLAILGFATVGLLLAVIMSRRMSPLVALIAVPTVAAVLAGMAGQIGRFVLSGLQQTAPVAAMFVFYPPVLVAVVVIIGRERCQ